MKKIAIVLVFLIVLFGVGGLKYFTILFDSKDDAKFVNQQWNGIEAYQDQADLAKAADHIFIGEVFEQVGHKQIDGKPNTQFKVRITQNIKSGFLDDVTVNMAGGYFKEKGKLYVQLYENQPLLKEGQMYMFSTKHNEEMDWEQIVAPKYGHIPLNNEKQKYQKIDEIKQAMAQ